MKEPGKLSKFCPVSRLRTVEIPGRATGRGGNKRGEWLFLEETLLRRNQQMLPVADSIPEGAERRG